MNTHYSAKKSQKIKDVKGKVIVTYLVVDNMVGNSCLYSAQFLMMDVPDVGITVTAVG